MTDEALNTFSYLCELLERVDPLDRVSPTEVELWTGLVDAAEDLALQVGDGAIDELHVAELSKLMAESGLSESQASEAVAWGIDRALWPTFTRLWLAARGGGGPLATGEWFPVTDVDRDLLPDHPTSLPSRLSVRAGELPHVRRFDPTGHVAVHVDSRFAETIDAAFDAIRRVATLHPNPDAADFEAPGGTTWFPITPTNDDQAIRIAELAADALLESPVVVAPELACPPDDELENIRQAFPGLAPRLLVTGSRHEIAEGGDRVNRALLLVGGDAVLHHDKYAPFIAADGAEGIAARAPKLQVLVSREWRVVVAVCKDLLSPDVVHTLCRIGANVVLVPAWTPKLDGFKAAIEMLVSHCQALVIIANGPPRGADAEDVASMLGRPVRASTIRSAGHPAEPTSIQWPIWE